MQGGSAEYNQETGQLEIGVSPMSLGSLDIELVEEGIQTYATSGYDSFSSAYAGISYTGHIKFKNDVTVGAVYESRTSVTYSSSTFSYQGELADTTKTADRYMSQYVIGCLDYGNTTAGKTKATSFVDAIKYNTSYTIENLKTALGNTEFLDGGAPFSFGANASSLFTNLKNGSDSIVESYESSVSSYLLFGCTHTNYSTENTSGQTNNENNRNDNVIGLYGCGNTCTHTHHVKVRILETGTSGTTDWVTMAFVSDQHTTQSGIAVYKFSYSVTPQNGALSVEKVSSDAEITDGNENYSLEGAKFTVYTDQECTTPAKDSSNNPIVLTTGADGKASTADETVPAGDYYVKETEAPPGYEQDTTVYSVTVTAKQTAKITNGKTGYDGKFVNDPKTGTAKLTKTSEASWSLDNSNYSLENATYRIYTDSECKTMYLKDSKAVELVTDATGSAEVDELPLGTYYIKEITAPTGYRLDTEVHTVTLTKDNLEGSFTSEEPPKSDPPRIILQKVDAETGTSEPIYSGAALSGAVFKVEYFQSQSDASATRVWHFKTTKETEGNSSKYGLKFNTSSLVSGYTNDELFTLGGKAVFPLGYLKITEVEAPEGYMLSSDEYWVQINESGADNDTFTFDHALEVPNKDFELSFLKLYKCADGTEIAVPGVTFELTRPGGVKETIVSDENGVVALHVLKEGSYTLIETETVEGMSLNTQEIKFTVSKNSVGKFVLTTNSTFEETATNGMIYISEITDASNPPYGASYNPTVGCYEGVIYNKPLPFSIEILKVSNKDNIKLANAEFTLYSDSACTKEVTKGKTDTNGSLTLEDLVVGETYYLKETDAPTGYRVLLDDNYQPVVWKIKAESNPLAKKATDKFTIYVNDVAYTTNSTGAITVDSTDYELNMEITNPVGHKLPTTGSEAMVILVVTGVGLIGTALVLNVRDTKNTTKRKKVKK